MNQTAASPATLPAGEPDAVQRRHVVSALVIDRPGTLNRVSGLLRARSFNIESLTVGRTDQPGRSRMTIAVRGDDGHLRQVLAQLERLIDVLEVTDLTGLPRIELELALVELDAPGTPAQVDALGDVLSAAGGATLSIGPGAWRAYVTAAPDAIDQALDALRGHGLRGLVRAGVVAMATSEPTAEPRSSQNGEDKA